MNKIASCIICVAFALSSAAAYGAQAVVSVGGAPVTVRTGSSGGQCVVADHGAAGVDVDCVDGGNRAMVNSLEGCVLIHGSGLCGSGSGILPGLNASTQLSCTNGAKYNVSTGDDQGRCDTSGEGPNKSVDCQSAESNGTLNTSTASCESGCGDTQGSGCCCQEGTQGCGGGQNCTGK